MRIPRANLVLALVASVVAFAAIEAVLRVVPNRFDAYRRYLSHEGAAISYVPDPVVGYRLEPHQTTRANGWCLDVAPFETNALGFRGDEPVGDVDVAVIGDSFVEGAQVKPRDHVGAILEQLIGGEVLNVAAAGYQTYVQTVAYESVAAGFEPGAAVLFLYVGNDITENLCGLGSPHQAYCGFLDGDSVAMRVRPAMGRGGLAPVVGRAVPQRGVVDWIRRNSALYHPLAFQKRRLTGFLANRTGREVGELRVFDPRPLGEVAEAWAATEDALLRFAAAVTESGARPLVAIIPHPLSIDPDWERSLARGDGVRDTSGIDPSYPASRLSGFLEDNGVGVVDLSNELSTYRLRHEVPAPGFGFRCDAHWNPLGHLLAAVSVASRLADMDEIQLSEAQQARLDLIRNTPPMELLGEEAFAQIFGGERGGTFTGATGVGDFLDSLP